MLFEARAPRATVWGWCGVLRGHLGDRVHDVLQGRPILHAPSPRQGRGVQGSPQLPGTKAPGLLCHCDGTLLQDFVQIVSHDSHTKVA
jgi:hypothetical protein